MDLCLQNVSRILEKHLKFELRWVYNVRAWKPNFPQTTHSKGARFWVHHQLKKYRRYASAEGASGRKFRVFVCTILDNAWNSTLASSNLHRRHVKTKLHQNHALKRCTFLARARLKSIQRPRECWRREREKRLDVRLQVLSNVPSLHDMFKDACIFLCQPI